MLKFLFIIDRSDHKLNVEKLINDELKIFILTDDVSKSVKKYGNYPKVFIYKCNILPLNISLMNLMNYLLRTDTTFNMKDVYSRDVAVIDSRCESTIEPKIFELSRIKNVYYEINGNDIQLIWFTRILDFFYFSLFESFSKNSDDLKFLASEGEHIFRHLLHMFFNRGNISHHVA